MPDPTSIRSGSPRSRYLSAEAKADIVSDWLRHRDVPVPGLQDPGGRGFPDPPIFVWTDRINALPHACTLQSCAGHDFGPADEGRYRTGGELWLWLTEPAAGAAYLRLRELATLPRIERVSVLIIGRTDPTEVLDVVFEGLERHDTLDGALEPLIEFLGSLE